MRKPRVYTCIKRLFDIVFSTAFLILLLPLFLLVGFMVLVCSRGPVFYKANRVGLNGRTFKMLKFRTMHVNTQNSPIVTLRSDSRVYPFGRFLRQTKIDELPQLWNVLAGQMSIVGPRPEDAEVARALYIGKYAHIMDIRPGITSLGSLYDYTIGEAYENEEDYRRNVLENKLDLELYYVGNMGPALDFRLIIKTITTILGVIVGKTNFKPPKELSAILENKHQEMYTF